MGPRAWKAGAQPPSCLLLENRLYILKDSNHCFNSLSIGLWSKDLKHLISGIRLPELQGYHKFKAYSYCEFVEDYLKWMKKTLKKSVQKEVLLQCHARFQVGTTGSNQTYANRV